MVVYIRNVDMNVSVLRMPRSAKEMETVKAKHRHADDAEKDSYKHDSAEVHANYCLAQWIPEPR